MCVSVSPSKFQLLIQLTNCQEFGMNFMPLKTTPTSYFLSSAVSNNIMAVAGIREAGEALVTLALGA
jgi:hypothetical protein